MLFLFHYTGAVTHYVSATTHYAGATTHYIIFWSGDGCKIMTKPKGHFARKEGITRRNKGSKHVFQAF